jgi:methionyl-tRNA formyltransferase
MSAGRRLRAVFLGTPEFAVPSLRALRDEVELLAVVTQPDRPQGRGRKVAPPPVALAARELGVAVLQPAKLRDPAVVASLQALHPDVIITVAYGKIIPPQILTLPPLGCVNVHPSLLPK